MTATPDRPADADGPDLDALKRLCDAATPGPWTVDGPWGVGQVWTTPAESGERIADSVSDADAEFIAAARTAVPQLLARVAALEAELDEARAHFDELSQTYGRVAQQRDRLDEANARLEVERDDFRAQLAQIRPQPGTVDDLPALRRRTEQMQAERAVIDAAKAWRFARPGPWRSGSDVEFHLFAAVDALAAFEPAGTAVPAPKEMSAALAAGHPLDDVDGTFDYINGLLRQRAATEEAPDA